MPFEQIERQRHSNEKHRWQTVGSGTPFLCISEISEKAESH